MKKLLTRSLGAFTMAEILISLTIIGVIAAITLPSLRANINEKTWATQKKALFSRMTQGIAMLDAVNSYDSAQEFVTSGLSEVLKINNICDQANLKDCGINETQLITTSGGATTFGFPKTWADLGVTNFTTSDDNGSPVEATDMVAAFETQNGESIAVFYNPDCVPDNDDAAVTTAVNLFPYVCANMVFDLNADKGPNTVGKDIGFMTVLYASDPVVATVVPTNTTITQAACGDDFRLPNLAEAVAMQLNWRLMTSANNPILNTSGRGISSDGTTLLYSVAKSGAAINRTGAATLGANSYCVKR